MTSQDQFAAEVEAFLSRTGMAPSTLGIKALNDSKFVVRLRAGDSSVTLRTVDRVRAFMRGNGGIPDTASAAPVAASAVVPPEPDPAAVSAIIAKLGGRCVVAKASRIAVTDLERMEADGRIWSQHRKALTACARAAGFDLDPETLRFVAVGKDHWRAA